MRKVYAQKCSGEHHFAKMLFEVGINPTYLTSSGGVYFHRQVFKDLGRC